MAISIDLRVLAKKLEKSSDDLLVNASAKSPEIFEKVATAIAAASTLLEGVADDLDNNAEFNITEQQLEEIAALASAFDESNDPLLQKQASVLDELLLSIAAPKNAASASRKVSEDEINRLREERRKARGEEAYVKPGQAHAEMRNSAAQAKAVEQQVKRFVPLEAPLQTRYPPDRPGGQMTRITDHVYQDVDTGIIYDYKAGYTTQKGNKVPGGSVENQTRQLGDYRNQGTSLFETRESLMGRYATENFDHIKKYALGNEMALALRGARDLAPEMLDNVLDRAYDDGLSTTEVGEILGDPTPAAGSINELLAAAGWGDLIKNSRESSIGIVLGAIQELAPHLLNAAIKKAKEEGLAEDQIKSIIASGFNSNSNFGELEEIKTAEILLPQLRALGWKELEQDHLKVMAKLGVSKDKIQKLSGNLISEEGIGNSDTFLNLKAAFDNIDIVKAAKDKKQYCIVKENGKKPYSGSSCKKAGVEPGKIYDSKREAEADAKKLNKVNPIGFKVIECGPGKKSDKKESSYDKLRAILKMAAAPLEDPFGTSDELPPANILNPDIEEDPFGPATIQTMPSFEEEEEPKETKPEDLFSQLFQEVIPAVSKLITPRDNLDEWNRALNSARLTISNSSEAPKILSDIRKQFGEEQVQSKLKELVNAEMNKNGFVGAFELDENADEWWVVARELVRLSPPKTTPKAIPVSVETPKIEEDEGGPLAENGVLPWKKYQDNNNITISAKKAAKLESQWKDDYANQVEMYDSVFSHYEFAGAEVPLSIEGLPASIRRKILPMYMRGETTLAVKRFLEEALPEAVGEQADELVENRIAEINRKMNQALKAAEELSAKGRNAEADARMQDAIRMEEYLKDESNIPNIRQAAINEYVSKLMPTFEDLKKARIALKGSENLRLASDLKRRAVNTARAVAINTLLNKIGLPDMFKDVKVITKEEFEKQLSLLGKHEDVVEQEKAKKRTDVRLKTKSSLIRPVKEGADGKPLTTIVEDPEGYVSTLKEIAEEYPAPRMKGNNPEWQRIKKIWDDEMEIHGYCPPSWPLYGPYGSTVVMLSGFLNKLDNIKDDNPFVDFKGLKNLFKNPEEYAEYYTKSKAFFDKAKKAAGVWEKPPAEFFEINAGSPDLDDVPLVIQRDIKALFEKSPKDETGQSLDAKSKFKDIVEKMQEAGVDESVIKRVWDSLSSTGKSIRGMIWSLVHKGKKPDEIRSEVTKRFPNAYFPPPEKGIDIIDFVWEMFTKQIEKASEIDKLWAEDAQTKGFYPPKWKAVGNRTSDELLKPRRMRFDSDVFSEWSMSEGMPL